VLRISKSASISGDEEKASTNPNSHAATDLPVSYEDSVSKAPYGSEKYFLNDSGASDHQEKTLFLLLQSRIANELRVMFHQLIGMIFYPLTLAVFTPFLYVHSLLVSGGNYLDIRFNDGKAINIPLFCKDLKNCSEFRRDAMLESSVNLLDRDESSVTSTPPGTSFSINNFKGINLMSETALPLADTEGMHNVLSFHGVTCNHSVPSHSLHPSMSGSYVNHHSQNEHIYAHAKSSSSSSSVPVQFINSNISSSRLWNFVEACDPTKSFLDLSLLVDEPVEEVEFF
jgi:hypothetical protein